MSNKKNVLVTGYPGFLARHLCDYILSADKKLPWIDNYNFCFVRRKNKKIHQYDWNFDEDDGIWYGNFDLCLSDQVKQLFQTKFDIIIHLAASSSSRKQDRAIFDNNIIATNNLLEHCDGQKFIFASSILNYGSNPNTSFYENAPLNPLSLYAITKVACENLVNHYYNKGKVKPIILRLGSIVGKYLSHGRLFEAINFCRGKNTGDKMTLYGMSPGSIVPYCYVDDVIKAILSAVISNRKDWTTVNICPDDYLSLEQVIHLCEVSFNKEIPREWILDPNYTNEFIHCYNTRAFYDLGWQCHYSSEQAVLKGLEDIKNVGFIL